MNYCTIRLCLLIGMLFCLAACMERERPAPVEELAWQPFTLNQKAYTVRKGDTLYAVAFKYDKDYRKLASYNQLKSPYALKIGQTLRLGPSTHIPRKTHQQRHQKAQRTITRTYPVSSRTRQQWAWPVKGHIAEHYLPAQRKKGIKISGKKGDKIRASSSGVVAYAGDGLVGYGNLIIIKHDSEYLTAYGNNSKNLVHEGQRVKQGQVIADMGMVARKYWGVHFEVRKNGKPVNPLKYLQKG